MDLPFSSASDFRLVIEVHTCHISFELHWLGSVVT